MMNNRITVQQLQQWECVMTASQMMNKDFILFKTVMTYVKHPTLIVVMLVSKLEKILLVFEKIGKQ